LCSSAMSTSAERDEGLGGDGADAMEHLIQMGFARQAVTKALEIVEKERSFAAKIEGALELLVGPIHFSTTGEPTSSMSRSEPGITCSEVTLEAQVVHNKFDA